MAVLQKKEKAGCIVIGLLLFFLSCSPLSAQEQIATSSALVIAPTFQEITLAADQTSQTAQITVTNQSQTEQTFDLLAVAMQQLDSQGNVVLSDKPLSNSAPSLSTSILFPEPTLIVSPGQKKTLDFTVLNSQNLTPGGNYAVIVLRARPDTSQVKSIPSVLPAVSSFVLIRKMGGEQYNLSLAQIAEQNKHIWWQLPKTLDLVFENQGNIHTTPQGQITITDLFGRNVVEGTINEGSQFVFPRTQRELRVQLRHIRPSWPIMLYTVTAQGESSPGNSPFQQQLYTVFFSLEALIIICSLMVIFIVGYVLLLRYLKKRHATTTA